MIYLIAYTSARFETLLCLFPGTAPMPTSVSISRHRPNDVIPGAGATCSPTRIFLSRQSLNHYLWFQTLFLSFCQPCLWTINSCTGSLFTRDGNNVDTSSTSPEHAAIRNLGCTPRSCPCRGPGTQRNHHCRLKGASCVPRFDWRYVILIF